MTLPPLRMYLGPVHKEYGPFRLRKQSLVLPDGSTWRELGGYQIMLPRPPQEDSSVTTIFVDDLPAVFAAVRLWLEDHQHMLTSMRQHLASLEQPEGRAHLQAAIDMADAADDAREARAGSPHGPRLTLDQVIANQRAGYEEEIQRHKRIEEALSELEASHPTAP